MQLCTCERPNPSPNPRHPHLCETCGNFVPREWSDIKPFFDWLEEALRHDMRSLAAIKMMRSQAEARHAAGVPRFGLKHLERDNAEEGCQEAADGVNYAAYFILGQQRRGEDPEWPLALTAGYHFARAYMALRMLQTARHRAISDYNG